MFDDIVSILNLGSFSNEERNVMETQKVEFNKVLSRVLRESRKLSKQERCYICNNDCSSFCNSHTVPAFCLRNIAETGDVLDINSLIRNPLMDDEKGVNKAGTFHLICRSCDSKVFSEYETPSNYSHIPTPTMISQIALKNYLRMIYKRLLEKEIYTTMCNLIGFPEQMKNIQHNIIELDLKDYIDGYKRTKRSLEKGWNDNFYICYYEKLDYVVPIAFQGCISLISGLEGEIINETYNPSPQYCIKPIHICIFPLENESVLLMFVDNKDARYRKFYKQLKRLPLEDRLATLTYIVFSYSEDVFFSKRLSAEILSHPSLIMAGQSTSTILSNTLMFNPYEKVNENYDLSKRFEIPNLLSINYKLR